MNAANTHFPSAMDKLSDQKLRGGIHLIVGHQYLIDLGRLGWNKHMVIAKTCTNNKEDFSEYVIRLISEDLNSEFSELDRQSADSENRIKQAVQKNEIIDADCTK